MASSSSDKVQQSKEYQVKAAFIYNFISYTTWPKQQLPPKGKPIRIAVIGANPFGKELEAMIKSRKSHDRKLETQHYKRLPEKLEAHVVFIAHDKASDRAKVLKHLKGKSVLVIGEHKEIALSGAHIGFYLDSSKVRFEVNLEALRTSKLTMSSQLLKLAKIVRK